MVVGVCGPFFPMRHWLDVAINRSPLSEAAWRWAMTATLKASLWRLDDSRFPIPTNRVSEGDPTRK
jgi:hypothetical protein